MEPEEFLDNMVDFTRAAALTPEVEFAIERAFEYTPWSQAQALHGLPVKHALIYATKIIIEHVPPSPDRSAALRKIREARMDCNSAITHGGKY